MLEPKGRVRADRVRAPVHVDAGRAEAGTLTVTSAVRGLFKDNPATRAEAMSFIGHPGNRCLADRSGFRPVALYAAWPDVPTGATVAGRGHGGRERDPGLLLRRRSLPRARSRDRPRDRARATQVPRCSTSAASPPVPAPRRCRRADELARVIPVIRALAADVVGADQRRHHQGRGRRRGAARPAPRSSTTSRPGRNDPELLGVVADAGAGYVAMHMQGEPRTMQDDPALRRRRRRGRDVPPASGSTPRAPPASPTTSLMADPGIGFGKTARRTTSRCSRRRPSWSSAVGVPVLVGDVAQGVPRPPARRRRPGGARRRHARDGRVGARPGRRDGARPRRPRRGTAPRICSDTLSKEQHA